MFLVLCDCLTIVLVFPHRPAGVGDEPTVKGDKVIVYEEDGYAARYTQPDVGQSKYGGWTNEGLKRYVELRDINKKARETDDSKILEQDMLDQVRAKYGLEFATYEEETRANKKRKRSTVTAETEAIDVDGDEE